MAAALSRSAAAHPAVGFLNGDRCGLGDRTFATIDAQLAGALEVQAFATHWVAGDLTGFRRRLDLALRYDRASGLRGPR